MMPNTLTILVAVCLVASGAHAARLRTECPVVNGEACGGHGICADHNSDGVKQCFCEPGFIGVNCTEATCITHCSEHGKCNPDTRLCDCDADWTGVDCSISNCPRECSGHGICSADLDNPHMRTCYCNPGWKGQDCSYRVCPFNTQRLECSGKGMCKNGTCDCDPGFKGAACEQATCRHPCSNGNCRCRLDGTCFCDCDDGWVGKLCDHQCPRNCNGHGECNDYGRCICRRGWQGYDCSQPACPKNCSQHGLCNVNGTCTCEPGWVGEACEELACPQWCNWRAHHGECLFDKCECYPGYYGTACEKIVPAAQALESKPCGEDCYDHCRVHSECEFVEDQIFHFQHDAMGAVEVAVPSTSGPTVDVEVSAATGTKMNTKQNRKCYIQCLKKCMTQCFEIMHTLSEEEREEATQEISRVVISKGQQYGIAMPNVTGDVVEAETAGSKQGSVSLAGLVDNAQERAREAEA